MVAPTPLAAVNQSRYGSFMSCQPGEEKNSSIEPKHIMSTAHLEDGRQHLHWQYSDDSVANSPLPQDIVRRKALLKPKQDHASLPTIADSTVAATGRGTATVPPTYDFILCDSVMPRMDGPTAVKKIRELGYTQPIFGT
jgi:hypothetical protein